MYNYRKFYVALGYSISFKLLVYGGGGLLKWVLRFLGNESSFGGNVTFPAQDLRIMVFSKNAMIC